MWHRVFKYTWRNLQVCINKYCLKVRKSLNSLCMREKGNWHIVCMLTGAAYIPRPTPPYFYKPTARRWRMALSLRVGMTKATLLYTRPTPPYFYPPHHMQIEDGTPFARWHDQGKLSFPGDEAAAAMYSEAASQLTAAGYEHYEVWIGRAVLGHGGYEHNGVDWTCFLGMLGMSCVLGTW